MELNEELLAAYRDALQSACDAEELDEVTDTLPEVYEEALADEIEERRSGFETPESETPESETSESIPLEDATRAELIDALEDRPEVRSSVIGHFREEDSAGSGGQPGPDSGGNPDQVEDQPGPDSATGDTESEELQVEDETEEIRVEDETEELPAEGEIQFDDDLGEVLELDDGTVRLADDQIIGDSEMNTLIDAAEGLGVDVPEDPDPSSLVASINQKARSHDGTAGRERDPVGARDMLLRMNRYNQTA